MKRFLDLLFAIILIVIFLFLMLIIAVLVRLTSRGPALYWSNRIGRENKIFSMPKFRTMLVETPQVATHLLSDSASCLTPIGRFLRITSLDELPQLWSILIGQMSFVGPRPALFNQDDLISMRTEHGIHRVRPGLTGWAQVNGRDDLELDQKVKYDHFYLENQCLRLDCKIVLLTLIGVLSRRGISH